MAASWFGDPQGFDCSRGVAVWHPDDYLALIRKQRGWGRRRLREIEGIDYLPYENVLPWERKFRREYEALPNAGPVSLSGKVAVGACSLHRDALAALPAFWTDAALGATTAQAWAQAAFDALRAEERLEAIDREIAALNDRRGRARTDAERMDIHRELKRLADERQALMGAPLD